MNEKQQNSYWVPKETWNRIVAKVWADEDYKDELIANSNEVLEREGVKIPEGMTVHIVEEWQPSTPSDFFFVLKKPNESLNVEIAESRKAAAPSGVTKFV